MSIKFVNIDRKPVLSNRLKLKQFIITLIIKEGFICGDISILFCSDDFLLKMNQRYLQHDTLTDIITFPMSLQNAPIDAEIYISVERIAENALLFNTPFAHELHRVIFHGLLHLCGYGDKTPVDKRRMRLLEDTQLNEYFN